MNRSEKSFLFVGTAKAGTTSIYNYLLQHPEIHIPKKETFYFLRDIYLNNSLSYPKQRSPENLFTETEKYRELYLNSEGRVSGEIGTGYLYHHKVSIPRIKEELGDQVKILMVLRHPVDRAYSSYRHFTKDLHEPLSFEDAMDKEDSRVNEGWDFMWQHRHLGLYSDQVRAYIKEFEHVKVLLYDDLDRDPKGLMKEIFDFLGVHNIDGLDTEKQFNPSGEPRSKLFQKLILHDNPIKNIIKPIVRALMSDDRRERVREELKARNLKDHDKMSPAIRNRLLTFYREDVETLEGLIDRNLDAWKT